MGCGYNCVVIIFLLALTLNTYSQVPTKVESPGEEITEKLDEYLVSANKAFRFNGSAVVVHNGDVLLNQGYGFSNFTTRMPNSPDTRFPILSITKSFTSTVILKLQEEGKLSVQDNLAKFIPEYPNGEKIKIYHLLTHTSGIYNYTDDVAIEDSLIVNYPLPKQTVLEHFMNKPTQFSPGKRYSYNNSGYFLLGLIIEKVTGKAYESVVRELIFTPLGMNSSGFDFINVPDSMKANGYQIWNEDQITPFKHYDSTFAYSAGSIYSTTNDMLKWAQALVAPKILTPETWRMAFTPNKNNYGYGWETGVFLEKAYVKHSGGYPGYMSEIIYYPEENLVIVLLNNFGTYGQNVWASGMGLSSIALGMPYDKWPLRKEVELEKDILKQYVGTYIGSISGQKRKFFIGLDDDRLFIEISGRHFPLWAESEYVFNMEDFNTQLLFSTDSEGKVEGLTIHEHGQDYELVRK